MRYRWMPSDLPVVLMLTTICAWHALTATAGAQSAPYNPYADNQEQLGPIAADGTIHWGTFYKSAAIQKSYERLWNLGACRNTNKAITIPVQRNKFIIDNLPETVFQGTVRGASGTIAGGLVAFTAADPSDPAAAVWVATLHPAGVSHLTVRGRVAAATLQPGTVVRLTATIDAHGKGVAPVQSLTVVTPSHDFKPDSVRPHVIETIIGQVVHIQGSKLLLRIDTGKIRLVSLQLSKDAVATFDASQLEFVSFGDAVEVTGRLWDGEGAMGAGTIFASTMMVTKAGLPAVVADPLPVAHALGAKQP